MLKTELQKIQNFSKKSNSNKEVEIQTKSLFLEVFAKLFRDYDKYVFIDEENGIEDFDLDSLVANRPPEEEKFYRQLSETQMYEGFLHKIKEMTEPDSTIFGQKIKEITNLTCYDGYAKFNEYLTTNKTYLLRPYFMTKVDIEKEEDVENELKRMFPLNKPNTIGTNLNTDNPEEAKIVGSMLDLEDYVLEEDQTEEE